MICLQIIQSIWRISTLRIKFVTYICRQDANFSQQRSLNKRIRRFKNVDCLFSTLISSRLGLYFTLILLMTPATQCCSLRSSMRLQMQGRLELVQSAIAGNLLMLCCVYRCLLVLKSSTYVTGGFAVFFAICLFVYQSHVPVLNHMTYMQWNTRKVSELLKCRPTFITNLPATCSVLKFAFRAQFSRNIVFSKKSMYRFDGGAWVAFTKICCTDVVA